MQELQQEKPVSAPRPIAAPDSDRAQRSGRLPAGELVRGKYSVRFARTAAEIRSALDLQREVFGLVSGGDRIDQGVDGGGSEGQHLIVKETGGSRVVGTYRICDLETAGNPENFLSAREFFIDQLPPGILTEAIEISRLCILREHRNKQVLYLLWKFLADELIKTKKRYLFGCCSIFSQDFNEALQCFHKLKDGGYLHQTISIAPKPECEFSADERSAASFSGETVLPKLFGSYLKIGARVCSGPAIDRDFKTVDYFMLFDMQAMDGKYFKMFFS